MDSKLKSENSVLHIGSYVSIIQSILFVIIALSAYILGIDLFIQHGFGSLYLQNAVVFFILCLSFILIALLGFAITPAEALLIRKYNKGLATIGSSIAYLGHAGTIAFFSWWLFFAAYNTGNRNLIDLATHVAPIQLGVFFELFFVGLWVWVIAYITFRYNALPKHFGFVSVAKAVSFWFTLIAFILNDKVLLVNGLILTAVIFGPLWHIWIAFLFKQFAFKTS